MNLVTSAEINIVVRVYVITGCKLQSGIPLSSDNEAATTARLLLAVMISGAVLWPGPNKHSVVRIIRIHCDILKGNMLESDNLEKQNSR